MSTINQKSVKLDKQSFLFLFFLGFLGSIVNNGFMWLSSFLSLGLYLDIIITITLVFIAGFLPGLVCAILSTVFYSIIFYFVYGEPYYWAWYLFILCSIIAVFIIRFFIHFFPAECKKAQIIPANPLDRGKNKHQIFGIFIMLTLLSLAMSILISVIGGLISTGINMASNVVPGNIPPETWFRMGFVRQGFSLLPSEIFGRIPVNIADKSISVFCGYAIALLIKKFWKPKALPDAQ